MIWRLFVVKYEDYGKFIGLLVFIRSGYCERRIYRFEMEWEF